MKAEKTYKQLLEFQAQLQSIANKVTDMDNSVPLVQLQRLIKKALTKPMEEFEEKVEDLRLKLCIRDEKTKAKVLDDKGQYQFTEENEKAFRSEYKALQTEIVEVHYNQVLSYQDLIKLVSPKHRPFLDWEDMQETLEPFYHNDLVTE
jgi:hypothetical protein